MAAFSPIPGVSDASNRGENKDEYWATEPDSKILASSVVERIKAYRESMRQTGLSTRIRKSWSAYMGYGPRSDADASRLTNTGDLGEILNINVNQYGSLATQVVTLTTGSKPAVRAIASNSDSESIAQAKFAEGLNDYYDDQLFVSEREYEATLGMVLLGESHIALGWDAAVGQPFTVTESGKIVRTGDVRLYSCTPFDIARDPNLQDVDQQLWVAFRRKVNKWELIAQFPDKKAEILASTIRYNDSFNDGIDGQSFTGDEFALDFRRKNSSSNINPDSVYVWEFRHKPSAALPNGRLLQFIDDKCVLFDTVVTTEAHTETRFVEDPTNTMGGVSQEVFVPESTEDKGYPYGDSLFFVSCAPDRVPGGVEGKTAFFDLLSLQEGLDMSASIIASAINAGGLQNLYVPRGSNVTANKLTGALNVIEYDGDTPPQAKDNVAINPAVGNFAETMVNYMRQRVSMNEVTTGDLQRAMPAQAMALLRAQSVEFHSRLQAAYEKLIQRSRTSIIKLLQMFADSERVALIAGKSNAWALETFKKQDIEGFDRFIIEPVNGAIKTQAGKVSFVMPLIEKGMINLQQYFQLFSTGRLDPIEEPAADVQASIQKNKELLMKGVGLPPPIIDPQTGMAKLNPDGIAELQPLPGYIKPNLLDHHWATIPEYRSVLEKPGMKDKPEVVKAVMEVVHYSMMLWSKQPVAYTILIPGSKPYPRELMAQQYGSMQAPPQAQAGAPPMPGGQHPNPQQMHPAGNSQHQNPQAQPVQSGMPNGVQGIKQPQPPKLKNVDSQLQQANESAPLE